MRRHAPLLTALAVLAAGLIWLLGTQPNVATASIYQPGVATPGSTPPQFRAQTLTAQNFDLAVSHGHPVILNFFATWCTNCRFELPLLQSTYQHLHPSGLQVIAVNFNDTSDVASFVAPYGLSFPVLLDPSSVIGKAYQVNDLPVTVFIDKSGRISEIFHGQLSQPTIDEALKAIGG